MPRRRQGKHFGVSQLGSLLQGWHRIWAAGLNDGDGAAKAQAPITARLPFFQYPASMLMRIHESIVSTKLSSVVKSIILSHEYDELHLKRHH